MLNAHLLQGPVLRLVNRRLGARLAHSQPVVSSLLPAPPSHPALSLWRVSRDTCVQQYSTNDKTMRVRCEGEVKDK